MIDIKKLENVFGIKRLEVEKPFEKLNVIYAPNGTAKSSIADAIKNVSIGESVEDVYGSGAVPTFEFNIDGVSYDETNVPSFEVIKYCGVDKFDLSKDNDYSNLVVSPSAKAMFSSSINSINDSLDKIDSIILSVFKKKGKGKGQKFSNVLSDALSVIAGGIDNLTLNFAMNFNTGLKELSEVLTEDEFYILASTKAKDIIQKPEVNVNLASYSAIVNKKATGKIIDSSFDIDKLNAFAKHIVEDLYFDDSKKRLLNINDNNYDKEKFVSLVDEENEAIYGTVQAKEELEKCRDSLNKTAGSTKFANLLLSKPSLVKHTLNYITFVNELFVTFLGATNVKCIENEVINIKKEQASIARMKSSLPENDNVLHNIWERFRGRFKFNKYDLGIKNKFDALTGNDLPRLVKYQIGTNIEINSPESLRFSTGEIKSFNLINFIIEVERIILLGNPFTIILDDAVDSFDYKNKYGIIDYLIDIKDNPLVQIIVLTHNFDFYRSVILSFGKGSTKQYFMYKYNTGLVKLYDVSGKPYYLSVADFNGWKNSGNNITKYLSFIPFLRNILQLQTCSRDPMVLDVDKYLHYEIGLSDSLDFTILGPIMNTVNFPIPTSININDRFLDVLDLAASTICTTNVRETNLEDKIVLGLYVRVFLERFLSKTILNKSGSVPVITNNYARTSLLINQVKNSNYLSDEQLSIVTEANVISPSYVHANSFMYEPLIDVDAQSLIDIANKIKTINIGL